MSIVSCRTPLHLACAVGHEAIVFHLCSVARADPNLKDSAGCTPLHRVSPSPPLPSPPSVLPPPTIE